MTEVRSDLTGSCGRLKRWLANPAVETVVIEHLERLARVGVGYVKTALHARGRSLVVEDCEVDYDLGPGLTEVLSLMCGRLNGRRGGARSGRSPPARRRKRCSQRRPAYRFCLDATPAQERRLRSHAGAARFAYNFGLALVKRRLDERAAGEEVDVPWTLAALRREWNARKAEVAPWWSKNSKEAASSGLAALADGLRAFGESRRGRRAGRRVGFPRFKRRGRGRESFRYSTGSFAVSGRTRSQLPRIGHVRVHEPTTKLQRKIEAGSARILAATISREGDRWFAR
jgi:Helix-turn-helix domain